MRRSLAALAFAASGLVGACAAGSPTPTPAPSVSPSPTTVSSPAADVAYAGAWEGDLVDPNGRYPVRLELDGCVTDGEVCGQLEYGDPGRAGSVLCASELTRTGVSGDTLALDEHLAYHPWMCLQTAFEVQLAADGRLAIDQLVASDICCSGTLDRIGDALPEGAVPTPSSIDGLGRITAGTALGGSTTQYAAGSDGSVWFPLDDRGQVARLDATTGEIQALIPVGDPGAVEFLTSDPHGVAVNESGVWVGNAAERSLVRIDPATNAVAESIPVSVRPYALALDGRDLWLTSFLDDRVLRVDLDSGKVVADIAVTKPTGIAIGFDGVWIVEHRNDTVVRIDPDSNQVVAEISLGERGPNDLCGMCVENVVAGDDAIWTANNEGRSVSRIDPSSNKVAATIDLPLRPWQVSAGPGSIWVSQFEAAPDGSFADEPAWAVARIDQDSNEITTYPLAGALGVTWAADALWVTVPGRRGDALARIEIDP